MQFFNRCICHPLWHLRHKCRARTHPLSSEVHIMGSWASQRGKLAGPGILDTGGRSALRNHRFWPHSRPDDPVRVSLSVQPASLVPTALWITTPRNHSFPFGLSFWPFVISSLALDSLIVHYNFLVVLGWLWGSGQKREKLCCLQFSWNAPK